MTHNPAGFLMMGMLLGWFPACGLIGYFVTRKTKTHPIRQGDPVAPTPRHVHVLDLERSHYTITATGGIYADCAFAGCKESFYVKPTFAAMYVAETVTVCE